MKKFLVLFLLFLKTFFIAFFGLCLCNIIALTVSCFFSGFASFGERIADLPYPVYAVFSLILAAVLAIVIKVKTK